MLVAPVVGAEAPEGGFGKLMLPLMPSTQPQASQDGSLVAFTLDIGSWPLGSATLRRQTCASCALRCRITKQGFRSPDDAPPPTRSPVRARLYRYDSHCRSN